MLEQAILVGLSAWRISALFSYERGPLDIFMRFRQALGVEHKSTGEPIAWPDGVVTNMLSCVWCISIWAALALWGIWQWQPTAVIILAASSVAISIEQWNRRS